MPTEERMSNQLDLMMLAGYIFESGGPAPKFIENYLSTIATAIERPVAELLQKVQLTVRWHDFAGVTVPGVQVVAADAHDGDMRLRVRVEDKAMCLAQLQFICAHLGFGDIMFKTDSPIRSSNAGELIFTVPSRRVYVLRTTR